MGQVYGNRRSVWSRFNRIPNEVHEYLLELSPIEGHWLVAVPARQCYLHILLTSTAATTAAMESQKTGDNGCDIRSPESRRTSDSSC